jgi:hypothetical protein
MSRVTLNQAVVDEVNQAVRHAVADTWFAEQVAEGFESSGGIKLGLADSDITLLTGNFVLAKEASALELGVPPVFDTDGKAWPLTIQELTALMLEYGQHRAALSAEYTLRRNNVEEE